jgi:TolA-binding protein
VNPDEAKNLSIMIRSALQANRPVRPIEPEVRRLLDRVNRVQTRRLYARVTTYGVTLVAAAAAFLLVLWPRLDKLAFTVGADPGVENRWIQAESETPVPVHFSDDSSIQLLPGTRARVASVTRMGANLSLETGRLKAKVTPRKSADWTISAGPYVVRVVGTEFDVVWDPEELLLEVEVTRGIVKVSGPVLAGDQAVSAMQRLSVAPAQGRATIATFEPQSETADLGAAGADTAPAESAESEEHAAANTIPGAVPGGTAGPTWQALAKRGDFGKAFELVERLGFDNVARTAGPEDLLQLADVARIGGQPARATQIFRILRRRFPRTRAASVAAYTMGVTAFDQAASYTNAARWFQTYLHEQPTGPLAAEALGRLMEAQERLGRHEQAQATARRYLDTYPKGPHRDVAERLTER